MNYFVVFDMQLLRNTYFGVNTYSEHNKERLVRTMEHILNLPNYPTMMVCGSFGYRSGSFGPGDSVMGSRHDKDMSGWLWGVN